MKYMLKSVPVAVVPDSVLPCIIVTKSPQRTECGSAAAGAGSKSKRGRTRLRVRIAINIDRSGCGNALVAALSLAAVIGSAKSTAQPFADPAQVAQIAEAAVI